MWRFGGKASTNSNKSDTLIRHSLAAVFKQKTAYEMRESDWSSDVCSSDLTDCGKIELPRNYKPTTRKEMYLYDTI